MPLLFALLLAATSAPAGELKYRSDLLALKILAPPEVARGFPGGEGLTPGRPARFRDVEVLPFGAQARLPLGEPENRRSG